MKNIKIERVGMDTIAAETLGQWAELYCEIWKEAPWNEDFWRAPDVIADFRSEMQHPDAAAYLAIHEGRVVGFTHGYSVDRLELQSIAGSSLLDGIFGIKQRVFYVDELGVAASWRGERISIALTKALTDSAKKAGVAAIVLRTDTKAYAARHVYMELGFAELEVHDAAHPERTYWLLE